MYPKKKHCKSIALSPVLYKTTLLLVFFVSFVSVCCSLFGIMDRSFVILSTCFRTKKIKLLQHVRLDRKSKYILVVSVCMTWKVCAPRKGETTHYTHPFPSRITTYCLERHSMQLDSHEGAECLLVGRVIGSGGGNRLATGNGFNEKSSGIAPISLIFFLLQLS